MEPLPHRLRQQVRKLHQRKYRQAWQQALIEGAKLIEEALQSGMSIEFVVVDTAKAESFATLLQQCRAAGIPVYSVREDGLQPLCTTQHPQGICAVVQQRQLPVQLQKPFLLIDRISDPGNLGTILRTADWFGIPNLIVRRGSVDPWNPKVVRGSMGAIFRLALEEAEDVVAAFQQRLPDAPVFALMVDAQAEPLPSVTVPPQWALMVGSEAEGIDPEMAAKADRWIRIPGQNEQADSLNAAVAVGIALYAFTVVARTSVPSACEQ